MEEDCPLCLEPLSNGPHTKFPHPMNGVCDGFDCHVTCQVNYVHMHLTQRTNLVCTRCNLDLAPQGRQHAARVGINVALARHVADQALLLEENRVLAEIRAERVMAQMVNAGIFVGDIFFSITGTFSTLDIVFTSGSISSYLLFGTAVVYTYMRHTPYLVQRNVRGGRTNRKKGGTRKNKERYVLKPYEVAVITIRDPTESIIRKVERMTGKRCKTFNYDELMERISSQ